MAGNVAGSTPHVASISACADLCNAQLSCRSIEYSPTKKICNRNNASLPTNEQLEDYMFCLRSMPHTACMWTIHMPKALFCDGVFGTVLLNQFSSFVASVPHHARWLPLLPATQQHRLYITVFEPCMGSGSSPFGIYAFPLPYNPAAYGLRVSLLCDNLKAPAQTCKNS